MRDSLLRQYLREERREEIYTNFQSARIEQEKGNLKFSSKIEDLKQKIEE